MGAIAEAEECARYQRKWTSAKPEKQVLVRRIWRGFLSARLARYMRTPHALYQASPGVRVGKDGKRNH